MLLSAPILALAFSPPHLLAPRVATIMSTRPALRVASEAHMLGLPITEVGSGLLAATGLLAWISPTTNLPGFKDYDEPSSTLVRAVGAWQLALAFVLLAGRQGATAAAGRGLYAAALTQLAVLPVWEYFGREKASQAGAILIFALLGRLTLCGRISPVVSAVVYLLTGTLIYFTPKATAELYQVNQSMSELGYSILSLYGGVIATSGVYLAGLAYGLAQPLAFAAAFGTNALISLKWAFTEATQLGAPKVGALLWAAISAALSALALK